MSTGVALAHELIAKRGSKPTDEYGTPDDLFTAISEVFGSFDMDGAAQEHNTKLPIWTNDASMETWSGHIWLNPPYSMMPYFSGLAREYARGTKTTDRLVAMLCRLDPSTRWWQNNVHRHADVWMLSKRVRFIGADQSYNWPSALVIYNSPVWICHGHSCAYKYFQRWPNLS